MPSPIPDPEDGKKELPARFEKIIKQLEAFSPPLEIQNNALAFLFYSLVNSANAILNTKQFRESMKQASFVDLVKGLEVLLDQIVKMSNNMGKSPIGKGKGKTIGIREKIKSLEIMRQEIISQKGE